MAMTEGEPTSKTAIDPRVRRVATVPPGRGRALIVVENNSLPFDRRVWREAQTLRAAGWQVVAISPMAVQYSKGGTTIDGQSAAYELIDGIHVYRYRLAAAEGGPLGFLVEYTIALAKTSWLTLKVWRRHGFDVMQVCNPPDLFFPLGWLCRAVGKGFVFDHHDLVPESIAERWRGWKGALLHRVALWAERRTMKAAHVVIATNESYKQIAIDRGKVAPSRVFVVRNGPLVRDIDRQAADPDLRNGRRFLVGYLGIMGPQDGLRILFEAIRFTILESGRQDIQFLLVGDGPERPWLIARARECGIQDYVSCPGLAVRMEDWRRYLSAPDVCVAPEPPTAFNSNSTITKVAEYMAMRQPIVAFDLKETRRTAESAAVYVSEVDPRAFATAVTNLLDDPQRRARMALEGERRVLEHLSWEAQEPALLNAYHTAVGSGA